VNDQEPEIPTPKSSPQKPPKKRKKIPLLDQFICAKIIGANFIPQKGEVFGAKEELQKFGKNKRSLR